MIGEEAMCSVTYLEFKDKTTTFPWLRASILCANLSSPRVVDGVAKLLLKSDMDRLKAKPESLQVENAIVANWQLLQEIGKAKTPEGLSCMARAMIRLALHLCKKESKGRDTTVFGSITHIGQQFLLECKRLQQGLPLVPSQSVENQPEATQPETLEDSTDFHQCMVTNVVCTDVIRRSNHMNYKSI